MAFGKGTQVTTGQGTQGTVVSEVRHPVTRNTTAVVVQPSGTSGTDSQVVANPATTQPSNG